VAAVFNVGAGGGCCRPRVRACVNIEPRLREHSTRQWFTRHSPTGKPETNSTEPAPGARPQERGAFTLVLSGGSLFKALAPLVHANAEWARWHVFFVDERNVPHSSSDSNFKGADEAFLGKVGLQTATKPYAWVFCSTRAVP